MRELQRKANARARASCRPKTRQCYAMLFRTFIGFCLCMKLSCNEMLLSTVMAFLEFLVYNKVSTHMIANHVSALRAMAIVYDIPFAALEHPKVKYFIKSLKINRTLAITRQHIMDLKTVKEIILYCPRFADSVTIKAIFLAAFFGFFRISNLVPHSISTYDSARHFSGGDSFFQKKFVKLLVKWSKTIQSRDEVRVITLPRLADKVICPYLALRAVIQLYSSDTNQPLFQTYSNKKWQPMTDSRVRKTLARIVQLMGLPKGFYTFHTFRRSGASLAYQAQVPLGDIKDHGTWTSDCVWTYIHDKAHVGTNVAQAFQKMIHNT